jgi:exonuclease III
MKFVVQNIGGLTLGNAKKVGGIVTTRCRMSFVKPDFLCLTETRIDDPSFNANWILSRYRCRQLASSGTRSGGVLILSKRDMQCIQDSVFNSPEGWFTIGIYVVNNKNVMIVGFYGPADGTDRHAREVLGELDAKMEEIRTVYMPEHIVLMGDFNLHLDRLNDGPVKKRACEQLQNVLRKYNLSDVGEDKKEVTWRRSKRSHKKSRIDYIFASKDLSHTELETHWGRFDHAELSVTFTGCQPRGEGGSVTRTGFT